MRQFSFPPERAWLPDAEAVLLLHMGVAVLLAVCVCLLWKRKPGAASRGEFVLAISLVAVATVAARAASISSVPVRSPAADLLVLASVAMAVAAVIQIAQKFKAVVVSDGGHSGAAVAGQTPGGGSSKGFASSECADSDLMVTSYVESEDTSPSGMAFGRALLIPAILVGGVAGWFLPVVERARETARFSACRCRFCSIILAAHNQADRVGGRFPAPTTGAAGRPLRSWRVEAFQEVSGRSQRPAYRRDEEWDSARNREFGRELPYAFDCPSRPSAGSDVEGLPATAHAMITGQHAFGTPGGRNLDDFPDGLAHTIAFGEAAGRRIPWTEPRDVELDPAAVSVNQPGTEPGMSRSMLSSHHPGRVAIVFADGRSRSISERIDPTVLRALFTADGQETIPESFD